MNLFDLVAVLTLNKSDFSSGLKSAEGEASNFGNKIKSGFGTIAKVGGALMTATTGAMIGFGKSAVAAGADFDKAMSQVAATMGKSVSEIQDLRNFAQEMGSTTSFSATEAAEALNYMALAGYDAETSMMMLPNVLNLAAAGDMELARASDMVTDAQTALGLSLEDTNVMVDQMAKISSTTNTSVSQLGDALLTVGGNAKVVQGGTAELTAVLGALADNGIKGSEAGTHLRNILLAMNPTTDKAANAWEQLGVKAYDAQGNMRNLEDIFMELEEAMAGMTEQEKTAMKSAMFNKTDLAAVNALLATNSDRWDEINTAAANAAGSADAMAKTQLDNLAGDVTLFKSALEGARIAISDGITPTLREFVQLGSEGLSRFTMALKEGGLMGAMDELGNFLGESLGKLLEKVPTILSAGGKLLGTVLDTVIDILPGMFDTIGNFIFENADSLFDGIEGLITKVVDFVANNIGKFYDGIYKLLGKIANRLPTLIRTITSALPKVIKDISDAIVKNAPELIRGATETVVAIAQSLPTIMMALVEAAPDIIMTVIDALIANSSILIDGLVDVVFEICENIPTIIQGFIDKLPEIIDKIFGEDGFLSQQNIGKLVDGAIAIVTTLVENIPTIISGLLSAIPGIVGSILGAFGGNVNDPSSLAYKMKNLFTNVCTAAGETFKELGHFASEAFDTILLAFSDPQGALEKAFNDIVRNFQYSWKTIKEEIKGGIELYDLWLESIKADKERERTQAILKKLEEDSGIKWVREGNTYYMVDTNSEEYQEQKAQKSKDFWGNRGTQQKRADVRNAGVIDITTNSFSQPNEPQKVDLNVSGNATFTVEGVSDEETFKQVNKAVLKKVQNDSRFYFEAGG